MKYLKTNIKTTNTTEIQKVGIYQLIPGETIDCLGIRN